VNFVSVNKMRLIVLLNAWLLLTGCSSMDYYMQAISGHLDLMSREKSIEDLLGEQKTNEDIKNKLSLALQAREFASKELKLPDNDSYKSYADLERPYVVWSVVATPTYSIKPKQWCFLIVGCLSYRGYFDKQEAEQKAGELKKQGFDVSIAGTTAYSTLGFFDDPLLSTMVRQSESSMIGIIFHELAQKHRQVVFGFLKDTRNELAALYQQDLPDAQKQKQKSEAFDRLRERYQQWQLTSNYHGFDHWMQKELNNSHLALIATYHDLVPGFKALLQSVDGDLETFYKNVEQLGALDRIERELQLSGYAIAPR
jgi:predicted aminopeptidase